MPLDPTFLRGVRALTFDCYGTLIDWDGGILAALASLPSLAGLDLARLVEERARLERELQCGTYLPYGEILGRSLASAALEQGRRPSAHELERFASDMRRWPAFPDAGPALRALAGRFRLAILSNVDISVLQDSVALLDAPFETLVMAEEVRSYKPATRHFEEGLQRLALARTQVLHVACSLYHDIRPAQALGLRTVWVNRLGEPCVDAQPDAEVPDMAAAARLLLA